MEFPSAAYQGPRLNLPFAEAEGPAGSRSFWCVSS